jgi:hypothetical protein
VSDPKATAEQWAARVAALAVDVLLRAGLVSRKQFKAACAIVAEEVFVRLCLRDYPPPIDYAATGEAIERQRERRQADPGPASEGGQ